MPRLQAFAALLVVSWPATAAPVPKPSEGGPVEIDFTPLAGQKATPHVGLAVRFEVGGKLEHYQAFETSGRVDAEQMARSVFDTLRSSPRRVDFDVERLGSGKLAVKRYKNGTSFTFRVEVTGLPKEAPLPTVTPIGK